MYLQKQPSYTGRNLEEMEYARDNSMSACPIVTKRSHKSSTGGKVRASIKYR
jgi:hypothetical protein